MKHLKINGEEQIWGDGNTFLDIVKGVQEKTGTMDALLAQEGFHLRELHHIPKDQADIRFLTFKDTAGFNAYRRSLCFLMLKSIADVIGNAADAAVKVQFTIGDGLYCTMEGPVEVNEEFLKKVSARMIELAGKGIPLKKRSIDTSQAIRLFHDRGMFDKEQLFRYRLSSKTNVYDLDGYTDYYYGYMVNDTSCLTKFELRPWADGFLLRCPQKGEDHLRPFSMNAKLFNTQQDSSAWGKRIGIEDVGDLNNCIVDGHYRELILTQEAWHEKQIAQIAQKIAEDPDIKIVLISGPSSSGKTTFSHRLSTQLTVYGARPHPIPMDDYFKNREDTPKHPDGTYDFECLEAIDVQQFENDMLAILRGEDVSLPTFNFKTGRREYKGKHLQIGDNDILVIEGIHGLNDALTDKLPKENLFRIYISALTMLNIDEHNRIPTTDGRLLRRIVRDARTRGATAKDTIDMWDSVRMGEEKYIFPFQESCDVMFNSALIYELAVLKVYAQPLLFSVPEDSSAFLEAKRLLKFLDYFLPVSSEGIPVNSLVREFIGGSCFEV